jgi:hypothetical protein
MPSDCWWRQDDPAMCWQFPAFTDPAVPEMRDLPLGWL